MGRLIPFLAIFLFSWSDRDWSGSSLSQTVPVDQFSSFRWDESFLAEGIPAKPPESYPLIWVMETNVACPLCEYSWTEAQKSLKRRGFSFGTGGHFQKEEVKFDHPLPVWKLVQGPKVHEVFVGRTNPEVLAQKYIEKFEAVSQNNPVSVFRIAKVDKKLVEDVLQFLGTKGSLVASNVQLSYDVSGVTLIIPANLQATWSNSNISLKPPITAKWGLLSVPISGLTYNSKDKIMIKTPLPNLMDPYIEVASGN